MTAATFHVAFAGPHVTVQDGGRPGRMRFGVPASGPIDRKSFALGNVALGNPAHQTGIEVSLGGLSLQCLSGAVTMAIAGGGFIVQIGERKLGAWVVITICAGQTLTIRPGPWGSWTFLTFTGILQAIDWLGSEATHGSSGFGGGKIETGQTLTITKARVVENREGPMPCPVWARPLHLLRCVLGPQDRFFAAETIAAFTGSRFELTDAFDRMGLRLRGPVLMPRAALAIPSEPILRGSVQISGDGVATVLLSDHQTTGGYPKIATVLSDDLDSFVQCRPRDVVAFRAILPQEAITATRLTRGRFTAFLDRMSGSRL